MSSNTGTSAATGTAVAVRPGGEADGAGLARLVACVRAADRAMAEAVALAGELAGSGVCEQVEGLPLERFAGLAARMTQADARFLVTAGQVLEAMPVTARLFGSGHLGWGQVRSIVAATRRLGRAERQVVDARVAATIEQYEPGAQAFDPDGLVWAVDAAVEELTPGAAERAERRRADGNFLSRQMDFDGGMVMYSGYDPLSAAVVNNAIDGMMGGLPAGAGQPAPEAGAEDAEAGECDGPVAGRWSSIPVARAAAGALVEVCAEWLGGDPAPDAEPGHDLADQGVETRGRDAHLAEAGLAGCRGGEGDGVPGRVRRRRARPLLVAHVDIAQVSASPSGTVELPLRGPLPRIAAATLERLANDADFKAVLFDGQRPLAVSRQVKLRDPPAKTRFALRARDGGCRFPGSLDPVGWTDVDHIVERERGGDHHPDNLVRFSRRPHVWRHRYGWTISLEPHSGMVTVSRGERRFHSLPRGTRLAPAPDDPDPPARPPDPPGDPPDGPPLPF